MRKWLRPTLDFTHSHLYQIRKILFTDKKNRRIQRLDKNAVAFWNLKEMSIGRFWKVNLHGS